MPHGQRWASVPPELKLLLNCARTVLDGGSSAGPCLCLRERPDWERLLARAAWHGLLPLLHRHLSAAHAGEAPAEILARLREHARLCLEENLFLAGELLHILALFKAAGLAAVVYKGPVLATAVWGGLDRRGFEDVDLLVRPADASRAQALLESAGYRPFYRLTPYLKRVHARHFTELGYGREGRPALADLHWGLVPPHYSFAPDLAKWWERLETVTVNGARVQTFGAEETLRLLCLHGLKHDWERLIWIADLAALLCARPDLRWEEVLRRASEEGHRRMLLLGLRLAAELLDAPLPAGVRRESEADSHAGRIAARIYRRLASGLEDRRRPFGISLLYPMGMERGRDRWRYYFDVTLAPTGLEWTAVPLPRALYPFYYLIRPVRVLGRQGLRLLGR